MKSQSFGYNRPNFNVGKVELLKTMVDEIAISNKMKNMK